MIADTTYGSGPMLDWLVNERGSISKWASLHFVDTSSKEETKMARTYAQDFVEDALRLVEEEAGMYKRVAERLGIPDSTLRGWYNKRMGKTRSGPRKLREYAPGPEETTERNRSWLDWSERIAS